MKLHLCPFLLFLFQQGTSAAAWKLEAPTTIGTGIFHPTKIEYTTLVNDEHFTSDTETLFKAALAQVGMLSITGIFSTEDVRRAKDQTLGWLHECAMQSQATKAHTYQDGTVRRTMATHTVPGGVQEIKHDTVSSKACDMFAENSKVFRSKVAEVTDIFAMRLSSILDVTYNELRPLLRTDGGYPFDSLADVVENGDHLEHFHSYRKQDGSSSEESETIEWHTDQGLFLAFTPGRAMSKQGIKKDSILTRGFYIELQDGSHAQVEFDNSDDLVFIIGDGMNQLINSRVSDHKILRALPHSLVMPDLVDYEARVWYGRMVLPPADALHPQHGITFSELREQMIDHSLSNASHIGCSSSMVARQLEETTCLGDSIYCWHRCMNQSAFGVSEDICADMNQVMNCTNPRGQFWDGKHGDFYPGCVDPDAIIATPYPTLPDYPRDNETCTNSSFVKFSSSEGYDHVYELPSGENAAMLMWSIVDGEVHGRITYNGLFGYLAIGFAEPEGDKNGMHGGKVFMAFPGGNYSAVTGLDLEMDPMIDEYIIDVNESSFRYWQSPYATAIRALSGGSAEVEVTECYSSLLFNATSISGQPLNVTGTDDLIWAANGVDYFAGYHGRNRARFVVDWVGGTGRVVLQEEPPVPAAAPKSDDHDADHDADHDHDEDTKVASLGLRLYSNGALTFSLATSIVVAVIFGTL